MSTSTSQVTNLILKRKNWWCIINESGTTNYYKIYNIYILNIEYNNDAIKSLQIYIIQYVKTDHELMKTNDSW